MRIYYGTGNVLEWTKQKLFWSECELQMLLLRHWVMSDSLRPHGLYTLPSSSVHGILQQEYWSGLPFPSLGDLPDQGFRPAFQVNSLPGHQGRPKLQMRKWIIKIQCDKCIFSKVPLLSYWWSAPPQHAWTEALGALNQLAALLCQVFEQCLDGRGAMWLVIVVHKYDNIVILIITVL